MYQYRTVLVVGLSSIIMIFLALAFSWDYVGVGKKSNVTESEFVVKEDEETKLNSNLGEGEIVENTREKELKIPLRKEHSNAIPPAKGVGLVGIKGAEFSPKAQ